MYNLYVSTDPIGLNMNTSIVTAYLILMVINGVIVRIK